MTARRGPTARRAGALAAVLALAGAGVAVALPQQQGSVDLLVQADGQWQGPGEAAGSSAAGASVAGLGDVFRRRRSALAIGAPEADPGGRLAAGSVYVVAGQRGTGIVDLTALAGRGFRIDGGLPGDQLGFAVAPLKLAGGDPGLALSAPYRPAYSRPQAGTVYVIDLRRLRGDVDLSGPGATPRAVVAEIAGPAACAEAGYSLASAGPARAGGPDGLLIGAPGTDPSGCPRTSASGVAGGNSGAAYLIPGARLRGHIDLASNRSLTRFIGVAGGDRTGSAVAAAGTPGAVLIGAPGASPAGRAAAGAVFLVRGARQGQSVSLAAPPAGSTTFSGAAADDALGSALASTGGYGRAGSLELALGAPQASPRKREHAGAVFLVPAAHEPAHVDLAAPAGAAAAGGEITGAAAGDQAGSALAGLGDVNGDGRADLAVGAPYANSTTGQDRIDNGAAYVLYGGGRPGLDLAALHSRGFVAFGARDADEAGAAVAPIGNGNGDGRPGVLIGAPFAENTVSSTPSSGGTVYLLFGFGSPALRYSASSERGIVGARLRALRPIARATGSPAFAVTPALPRGITLDPRTGVISGTPRAVAPARAYTIEMSDLAGVADWTLTLSVAPRG